MLDVGCGVGSFYFLFCGMVGCLSGIDVLLVSLMQVCLVNFGIDYCEFDGSIFLFVDVGFDFVIVVCVMYYVELVVWVWFMVEMWCVVWFGGLVCVIEYNFYNLLMCLVVVCCEFDCDVVLFGVGMIWSLMVGVGLCEIEMWYFLLLFWDSKFVCCFEFVFGGLWFGG